MTFSAILGVAEIICSFRLVLEGISYPLRLVLPQDIEILGCYLVGASLALGGSPSSDGVTIKMPCGLDPLH